MATQSNRETNLNYYRDHLSLVEILGLDVGPLSEKDQQELILRLAYQGADIEDQFSALFQEMDQPTAVSQMLATLREQQGEIDLTPLPTLPPFLAGRLG